MALLDRCGSPVTESDPDGMITVVRSEKAIQAMDFWLRNPDYLADEILTMVDDGRLGAEYIEHARNLLDTPEPDLRWYPMPRWLYGAYEPLDDAFAFLELYGLAKVGRVGTPGNKPQRSQFFLTAKGAAGVAEMGSDPLLGWYVSHAELVEAVVDGDNGKVLKERQYAQRTYAETELGSTIAPITSRVRARLDQHTEQATEQEAP
ncbi:hypothetical protein AERYTH_01395 [Aeromicrobium erythreum]|uniref:Uncharacterized protein n=1 Tax=Aeromicrobium erythreum TaxID=2041 RepID=A0A0U3TD30_9ACTN|nr:hypothetical protein AERYTH_01395 [Aeromicrobium erythreum]